MAIVKTENHKRFPFGVESILPVVGKCKVALDGTLDVDDTLVDEFLEVTDFYLVEDEDDEETDEDLKEKSEGNDLGEEDESLEGDDDEDDITLSAEDKATIVASLPSLRRVDLQGYCKAFPTKEWNRLDKEGLIKYLTEKFA